MKYTCITTAALLAAIMLPAHSSAQRNNRHEKNVVSVLVNKESADASDVEEAFKQTAPVSTNDNGLPRFAIVGKNREFYLGIGAQFLGEAVVDWGDNNSSSTLFVPSSITPSTPGNKSNLGFGWQTSSVYLNFVALPHTDNQVGIFYKMNFMGDDNAVNVFHFYGKYRGLTAGYTYSLFYDGAAEPMTIDFEGPNGYPCTSLFTAYWTQKFNNHLSGAIGIDAPSTDLTTGRLNGSVNQRIPAIPLYLQYGWNGGDSHVRLSGIVRPMQYRNLEQNKNAAVTGYGVQLSGITEVVGPLTANFNATYGAGIASYIQDDEGLGLDAVPTLNSGKMEAIKTMGLTGGLSYKFSDKISSNVAYSHVTNWKSDNAVVDGTQYRHGDYVAANVIYTINKFVSAGVEYDYGHKKSFDGVGLHTNRIQCQLAITL